MNPRTTRILLALVAVLSLVVWLTERGPLQKSEASSAPKVLFPGLESDPVLRVEVLWPSNRLVRAEQTNRVWQLSFPTPYPAQQEPIQRLVDAVASLRSKTYISAREILSQTNGRAAYGLEPPAAAIVLLTAKGRHEVRFGNAAFGGHHMYAQLLGAEGIEVVDSSVASLLPRSADDWRTRSLFVGQEPRFDRIEVKAGTVGYELRRAEDALWRLTKPVSMRANHPRVENMLTLVRNADVERFVADPPLGNEDLYGLRTPRAELTLSQATTNLYSLRLGDSPSNRADVVYAQLSPPGTVVLVPQHFAEIFSRPYNSLLDPQLIQVPTNRVDRVEVIGGERFTLARQAAGGWSIIQPRVFEAEPELVRDFLANLNRLEILDVEKDVVTDLEYPKYGLSPTNWLYTVQTSTTNAAGVATNQTLAQIHFGAVQDERVYVRRSDETPVYLTRWTDALLLPQWSIQLRKRQAFSFATNEVVGLTIQSHTNTLRYARDARGQWTRVAPAPGAAPLALDETLFRLGQLEAEHWLILGKEQAPHFGIRQAAHRIAIEIQRAGQTQTLELELGARSSLLTPYAAVKLPDQPEKAVFQFRYWFYEPYRVLLRELGLPLPDGPG